MDHLTGAKKQDSFAKFCSDYLQGVIRRRKEMLRRDPKLLLALGKTNTGKNEGGFANERIDAD